MMKHAENVPPVYEIIWQCDTGEDQVSGGQSRFFSCSRGTDAEQQKVHAFVREIYSRLQHLISTRLA